jgi:peptidoglycan hydrolase CwlO-like protein
VKFSDIPTSIKMTVASVAVIMTAVTFLYTTFQTDAEAAQYQEQNTQEIVRFRVQDLEKQIRELEYKLEFTSPPPKEKAWMQKNIDKLKEDIDKIEAGKA